MNIICPIFLESSSEKNLLRAPYGGEPYVDNALRRLNSEEDVRLNILTDHKDLYQHFADEGFNVFWVDAGCDLTLDSDGDKKSDDSAFAHFRLPMLKKRLGDMPLDGTDELVLLDIRYPLVTYPVINEALEQYHRSKKALLVSVSQPIDHPAQIETYYIHVGFDILSMIDEDYDICLFAEDALARYGLRYPVSAFSSVCFSKPFPFNWEGYRIQPDVQHSLIYRVYDESHELWPRPCLGVECMERFASQPNSKYFLFENINQARRLYSSAHLETCSENNIRGLSFSKSVEASRCLISGGEDGTSAIICLHGEYVRNNYLMRIESTVASIEKDSLNTAIVDIDRHVVGTHTIEAFGAKFHEMDIRLDRMMPGDHWTVTILENVSCGTADMSHPVQLTNAPWYTDPRTKRKYDSATERELTGRQLLPKVYSLDGALLVADVSNILNMEAEIDYDNAKGFVLSGPISRRVSSEIDFLRLISA